MGSLGEGIRGTVRSLLADNNIRSELTLTPVTITKGDYGGYEQNTETESTSVTVYCVPFSYAKSMISDESLGKLRQGQIRFLIRDDETIDEKGFDKVEFSGDTYQIDEIRPIYFNEVTVAQTITLSKEE